MFINHNANPANKHVGDCTVRAISAALGKSWEEVFIGVCLYAFMEADMPSANHVWGMYLKRNGYRRYNVDDHGKERYTVDDFCKDHPKGVFVLALSSHVIAVIDGNYYDTWDSGGEVPIYYWKHED